MAPRFEFKSYHTCEWVPCGSSDLLFFDFVASRNEGAPVPAVIFSLSPADVPHCHVIMTCVRKIGWGSLNIHFFLFEVFIVVLRWGCGPSRRTIERKEDEERKLKMGDLVVE